MKKMIRTEQIYESMHLRREKRGTHPVTPTLVEVPPGVQLGVGHPPFHISPLAVGTTD